MREYKISILKMWDINDNEKRKYKLRTINKIIIHCSASDHPHHDSIDSIRRWHVNERKWSDIGYHYVITKDGALWLGRPIHKIGAHAKGFNDDSIGICLTGEFNFSENQFTTLINYTIHFIKIFDLYLHNIKGHYEINCNNKTCPNFDMEKLREDINLIIL